MTRHRLRMFARGVGVLLLAAAGLTCSPTPASAPLPLVGDRNDDSPNVLAQEQRWITLVTGDRVRMQGGMVVDVRPARGREGVRFLRYRIRDEWHVLPSDALLLLEADKLDEQLFNVTGLVRDGFDDASMPELPLIATYDDGAQARSARGAARPGAHVTRTYRLVNATGLAERKGEAAAFWASLTGAAAARSLPDGLRKLWLDAKLRVSLDQSVLQIGAPVAHQAGLTGRGVRIAVLDTGYDPEHPDLMGAVVGAKSFFDDNDVVDREGHGTHVASIAVGRGIASNGRYRGVAPEAELLVGKVCDDGGRCFLSNVIAGMEWAVEQGADVVNLSLGAGGVTDGTDPASQAVNQLTASSGTLFVAAAGNFGPTEQVVAAPAAADAALAVANVDGQDRLAASSSRGPRLGDYAVKPEISAPGSIVAARAKGSISGGQIDEYHARRGGTSQAAPHVTGAAALLVELHPDWTPERLKAALMSTATPLTDFGPYEVGTGRLDVARAVSQPVYASPASVSAYFPYPKDGQQPSTKIVTYYNDGDASMTLNLDLDVRGSEGGAAPDGVVELSAHQIVVPARGTVGVEVTLDHTAADGLYSGRLVATSVDGAAAVQTAVAVYDEPVSHELVLSAIDRNGAPIDQFTYLVVDIDENKVSAGLGPVTERHFTGRYTVFAVIETGRAGTTGYSETGVIVPELTLEGDTAVTLDARNGELTSIRVEDRPEAEQRHWSWGFRQKTDGGAFTFTNGSAMQSPLGQYVVPTPRTYSTDFLFFSHASFYEPRIKLQVIEPDSFAVPIRYKTEAELRGDTRLAVVDGGAGTPEDLSTIDAEGKLVLVTLPDNLFSADDQVSGVEAAGGRAALLLSNNPNPALFQPHQIPVLSSIDPAGSRLRSLAQQGPVTVDLHGVANSSYAYDVFLPEFGGVPDAPRYALRTGDMAAVETFTRVFGMLGEQALSAQFSDVLYGDAVLSSSESSADLYAQPSLQTRYYSTGASYAWQRVVGVFASTYSRSAPMRLEPGRGYHEVWQKAPYGPAFPGPVVSGLAGRAGLPWAFRKGDTLDVLVPLFSESAPGRFGVAFPGEGTTTLYRDGQQLGSVPSPGFVQQNVPAAEATYRVETTATREQSPLWPLSTRIDAAWTFRSGHVDGAAPQPLPLMAIRYDVDLDDANRAPAGQAFAIGVEVQRQQGATTSKEQYLALQVSYDEGMTWLPAEVNRMAGRWQAIVQHPAGGYVSLKANVTDGAGNSVEQTIIRAYALK